MMVNHRCALLFGALSLALSAAPCAADGLAGAYLMLPRRDDSGNIVGLDEMKALAANAATLPINRIYISFLSPTMVYEEHSNTLEFTGLNASSTPEGGYGFDEVKKYTAQLQAGGVEVFASLGGWNYNCYPFFYTRYSVGGYGTSTPNFWKVEKYGSGDLDQCVEQNQWCYTCEPESEGTSYDNFAIFPEPDFSDTWKTAQKFVESGASASGETVEWHPELQPGSMYTDPKTGTATQVPGNNMFLVKQRDPYQDLVYLAKDLGLDGVDIDYEEFWHADTFKTGSDPGPFNLTQTVFKYTAVVMDVATNIKNIYPSCKLSTAAAAVGAWSTNWWGGNLKGLWYYSNLYFPFAMEFMYKGDNAGGINVMTYDLSDNPTFHECPEDDVCDLDAQVDFYMNTFTDAGIAANVGYEVSTPAYPDPTHDDSHQLPLTKDMLKSIIGTTQGNFGGGFQWELYKGVDDDSHASPTDVAQAVCNKILGTSNPRCSGTIPDPSDPGPGPSPSPSSNTCSATSTCNVCEECCKSYLSSQTMCDACVSQECQSNVCSADSSCTVCDACCKSYIVGQDACDACVKDACSSSSSFAGLVNNLRPRIK